MCRDCAKREYQKPERRKQADTGGLLRVSEAPQISGFSGLNERIILHGITRKQYSAPLARHLCIFVAVFLLATFAQALSETSGLCPRGCTCAYLGQNLTNELNGTVADCTGANLTTWSQPFPPSLVVLILNDNKIKALSNLTGNTTHYDQVQKLSARSNLISFVHPNAFDSLGSLVTLDLGNNLLPGLEWTSGLADKHLTSLDLSRNSLREIRPGALEALPFLERLDLSHNYITVVEHSAFAGFVSLRHLDLSSNALALSGLRDHCFDRLATLNFLSLANNRPLARVPAFSNLGLESATDLDLHGLPLLDHIESFAFQGLSNLRKLNLSDCGIQHLEQGWLNGGPQSSLGTLDLSRNRIVEVDSYTLVTIAVNRKLTDPAAYSDLRPGVPAPSYVVSPSVGESVQHVQPVTSHTLNEVALGPSWYRPLVTLQWLSLADNHGLARLDQNAFAFLPELKFLFLQNCNLTSSNIASVQHRYHKRAIPLTLPSLRGLWLSGNPLFCDCYVRELRYALDASQDSSCSFESTQGFKLDPDEYFYKGGCVLIDSAPSVCYEPTTGRGSEVGEVPMRLLRCPDEPVHILVVLLIGPFMFAASIGIVMVCGAVTVCVTRVRRKRAGKYFVMTQKLVLSGRDRTPKSNGRRMRSSPSPSPSPSPYPSAASVERPAYGTNLALRGFSSPRQSSGISFQIPSPFTERRPRPRTPSPTSSRSSRRVDHPVQFRETHLGTEVRNISRSCTDVSGCERITKNNRFWQHEWRKELHPLPGASYVTVDAQVNERSRCFDEELLLLPSSASSNNNNGSGSEAADDDKPLFFAADKSGNELLQDARTSLL